MCESVGGEQFVVIELTLLALSWQSGGVHMSIR